MSICSSTCSGHMLHHGPLHVLHRNTYSGAWSTSLPLSLIFLFPVLFLTLLPVQHFCTFLNMLSQQHHEPNSCAPLQPGVGLWQSLSLAQGSHNSFSQMPFYSPPQLLKSCHINPKIRAIRFGSARSEDFLASETASR